jgi:hypothetical protein
VTDADDELGELRRRAYGRGAGLDGDDAAQARLRELEDRARPATSVPLPSRHEDTDPDPATTERSAPALPDWAESPADGTTPEQSRADASGPGPRARAADLVRRALRIRPRRSTVLLGVGVLALVAILITTLTVVQRVQSDPLDAGARQIARIPSDPGFELPVTLFGDSQAPGSHGFAEFHGLRTMVVPNPSERSTAVDRCLYVVVAKELEHPSPNGNAGFVGGSCGAGGFAAAVPLRLTLPDMPTQLRSAYPDASALDFVYDGTHDEVVVFAD